jgi:hypothetical protein
MALPREDQVPSELVGPEECGPRAVWATLRYFGIDRSPTVIKDACRYIPIVSGGTYNPIHGSYLIGVAVAPKECGLEVEWSTDDPEPYPRNPPSIVQIVARAVQLGIVPVGGMGMDKLAALLDGSRVAIISHNYLPFGGAGHITPTSEVRDGTVVFPLEKENPTIEQLERARMAKDQWREVVLARPLG